VQNTNLFQVRWLKNGSFDFAEGLASCVGAKANVPLWVGRRISKFLCGGVFLFLNFFSLQV